MSIRNHLVKMDPVLKLAALLVLCCCIAAAQHSHDVWVFFVVAFGMAWAASVIELSAHAARRHKRALFFLLVLAVLGLWQTRFFYVWLPLQVLVRFVSLMLLGWTFVKTTPACSLAASAARLPLLRFTCPLLLLATAIVPAIHSEALMTIEVLRFRKNELPEGKRLRAYPRLLCRSAFVFVLRVFMRADELAEVGALRGLENPSGFRATGPYRPSFHDLALCVSAAAFSLIVVVY